MARKDTPQDDDVGFPMDDMKKEEGSGDDGDDVEEDADDDGGDEKSMVAAFCHKIEATLRQPSRNLAVRELVLSFDQATVFGKRAGWLRGLILTVPPALNSSGCVRQVPSEVWKFGCVYAVYPFFIFFREFCHGLGKGQQQCLSQVACMAAWHCG